MFTSVLVPVVSALAPLVKDLVDALLDSDEEKAKHTFIELRAAAELIVLERARGG